MNRQASITALMSSFGRAFHTENEVHAELEKLLGRHGFRIYDWLAPCNIQTRIIESAGANLKAFEHVNYCLAVRKN